MVKCIIVDDEPLALQVLESHIKQTQELELVKKCSSALEAFEVLSGEKIDLVFLDIRMPVLNGIDFIKSLKSPPAVIFTTAYSEYAVSSYELDAIDYLVKPVTFERFTASVSKFLRVHINPVSDREYSYFKVDGKLVKLAHSDILYAQSIKDYIIIKTLSGNYIIHMTMKALEQLLSAPGFIRVHRSFLLATKHISSLGKSVIELAGIKIPVGGNYKNEVEVLMGRLKG